MNRLLPHRWLFGLVALAVVGLLGFAVFLEHIKGLEPCPLCLTQRVFLALVGVTAALAWAHGPGRVGHAVYGGFMTLWALAGAGFATRHLWLQSLPEDEAPACGPSAAYILDTFPWQEALTFFIKGDGNCAEVAWRFLGLSIPGWTLLCFLGLAALGLCLALCRD